MIILATLLGTLAVVVIFCLLMMAINYQWFWATIGLIFLTMIGYFAGTETFKWLGWL